MRKTTHRGSENAGCTRGNDFWRKRFPGSSERDEVFNEHYHLPALCPLAAATLCVEDIQSIMERKCVLKYKRCHVCD